MTTSPRNVTVVIWGLSLVGLGFVSGMGYTASEICAAQQSTVKKVASPNISEKSDRLWVVAQ